MWRTPLALGRELGKAEGGGPASNGEYAVSFALTSISAKAGSGEVVSHRLVSSVLHQTYQPSLYKRRDDLCR